MAQPKQRAGPLPPHPATLTKKGLEHGPAHPATPPSRRPPAAEAGAAQPLIAGLIGGGLLLGGVAGYGYWRWKWNRFFEDPVAAMGAHGLTAYNTPGIFVDRGAVTVRGERFRVRDYAAGQNSTPLYLSRSWSGDVSCSTTRAYSAWRTRALFLPWTSGLGCRMSIDIDADFFLTAPLNGCAVVIGGTRTHPIVIHVNYASDRLDPPHLDRMTREQLERAYREHQVGVYGVFYRALAVELCRRGHLGGHVRALFEPNDYLTRGGGQARVFGIKRGNRWSFYASIDLEGRRPSNTRCATELIW